MTEYGYHFDYTKTMMMKMYLATPDRKGGSDVSIDFDKALDLIKKTDALTLGVHKIIYLVGWQYNGHDDRYPEFFEVNEALKSPGDASARDSLLRLMEEAKRYNTTVSFHINFTDAYADSELYGEYLAAGALIRKPDGTPDPIEEYNGKPCYKVSFYEEWNSGLFRRRFDRFLECLPAAQTGTVHVDNFQCYYNNAPDVDIADAQAARNQMLDYVRSRGLDVTSEFAYREGPLGRDSYNHWCMGHPEYPIATLGRIAALWWFDNIRDDEYLEYPPQYFGGGIPHDPAFAGAFYGNIHGEHLWMGDNLKNDGWIPLFVREFCMIQLPYFYLCGHRRERIENDASGKTAYFSGNVVSRSSDETILENGVILKDGHSVLLPLFWRGGAYIFYSDAAYDGTRDIPGCGYSRARVSRVTASGTEFLYDTDIANGKIRLAAEAGEALLIEPGGTRRAVPGAK